MTNGNTALPVAHSTNSKQSEGGERERRGVIRKRKEEWEETTKMKRGLAAKDKNQRSKDVQGDIRQRLV